MSFSISLSLFYFLFLQLDKIEGVFERPNDDVIQAISKTLRKTLGISLFGIDIIINNQTGQHAVIDINAFPGESKNDIQCTKYKYRTSMLTFISSNSAEYFFQTKTHSCPLNGIPRIQLPKMSKVKTRMKNKNINFM